MEYGQGNHVFSRITCDGWLLLDEPLNGLDNEGVEEIRKVLLSLKEKGKLIILASHSKEDIQILCDTVFRMDHGKIIATETN